jgi:predicted CoA-substrate-specific enzyme activase
MGLGLGIDSGSTMTKGALFGGEKIVSSLIVPTTANPAKSIRTVYEELYSPEVTFTVSTGYGRALLPEADQKITEITCHARGAAWMNPGICAVIDIGGQDCKVIQLDRFQNVSDFLMNDKCAAGTGRFIEVMLRTLEQNQDQLDELVKGAVPVNMTSMCTVFAESEMISLLAKGEKPENIALGMIHSICKRTANFAGRLNLDGTVFFSGGLARYEVFRKTLEEYLHHPVVSNERAQLAGAIGGAVLAYQKGLKRSR